MHEAKFEFERLPLEPLMALARQFVTPKVMSHLSPGSDLSNIKDYAEGVIAPSSGLSCFAYGMAFELGNGPQFSPNV
jgi:hypothetical protein